jgi:23S rRNA (uracil1939-C5)-methyltransferase
VSERATHRVTIHGVAAGGAGVGKLPDGRAIFVHRTAPGDAAEVRVTLEKARWARGELDRLLEAGPGRREAPCVHYPRCGGCTLQHLEPEAQYALRTQLVEEALRRIGGLAGLPPVEPLPPGPEFGYRNRASFTLRRLGVRDGRPRLLAGFHALERPGHIVDLGVEAGGACLLLEPAVATLWEALRTGWGGNAGRLPAGSELRLTLRGLADGSGVLLVEGGSTPGDPEALLAAVPGLRTLWWRPKGSPPRLLAGAEEPGESWFGEEVPVGPGAFLQVNRVMATRLHAAALSELDPRPGDRVVDAYAGFGVYGRAAARAGAKAVGIELDPHAVAMGRARPVEGFTLEEGAVEVLLPRLLPAERVLLNPPRAGVDAGALEALVATPPARVVYVSCDPATLARDLARLVPTFRVHRIQVADLFPQTAHVETVVTLDGVGPGPLPPNP